jgi:hypothetical protein
VPITTKVVSLNSAHGEVYSIQHCVVKFVSDLRQIWCFLVVLPVSPTNKTDRHDTTEILLKVVLNTLTLIISDNLKSWVILCEFISLFIFDLTSYKLYFENWFYLDANVQIVP